jgi:hypothetical protein
MEQLKMLRDCLYYNRGRENNVSAIMSIPSKIIIKLINWYQSKPCFPHSACVFEPTCSEYMKLAVKKYGAVKGLCKGIKRILRCKPKNGGIDYP